MKSLTLIIICVLTFACTQSAEKPKILIGSEGKLRGGSSGLVIVAPEYETLSELAKAQVAKDKQGIDEIKFSERVRWIPDGTKVLVIDGDWAAFKVRVLEGNYIGKVFWVDASAVVEPNTISAANQESTAVANQTSKTKESNSSNYSSLFDAASKGDEAEIIALLNKGNDVNAKAADMRTPLFDAVRIGHSNIVRILLKQGADVNARHQSGVTPIMWAVMDKNENSVEIVKILLAAGADVRVKDNDGDTALKLAKKYKNKEIIQMIEQANYKVQ